MKTFLAFLFVTLFIWLPAQEVSHNENNLIVIPQPGLYTETVRYSTENKLVYLETEIPGVFLDFQGWSNFELINLIFKQLENDNN